MANLTLYTIVRRICHIKDCASHRAKAVSGRLAGRPRAPVTPGGPEKPARLRFKSRGFSIQAWVVYKPAGRWLAGFQATPTLEIKTQTCAIFAYGQTRRQTQLALAGANASVEGRTPRRLRHPSHRAPSACSIRPIAPKHPQPWPQCPRRSQHPAHHAPKRPQHPAHRTPSARSIRPAMPPGACGIRPAAPKRLQPSPGRPQHPTRCTPDTHSLPYDVSLVSLAWAPLAYHVSSPDTPAACNASDSHPERP